MKKKVILYIAMSLDGYIARENNELDFLKIVERAGEDYGYYDFIKNIDTVVMGRKTYDMVLDFGIPFPHKDKKCYVLTRSKSGSDENVTFYNGALDKLISELRRKEGKDIFIDGGAETVNELLQLKLIDKLIISVIPVLLGNGIKLFNGGRPEQKLELLRSSTFSSGLVQLWYEVK
ncbi:MAG: dihydrofolate reductase [Bacteroidetes bacterium 46-16]|nr:MAG: dihydrofolate reductase [Bacteroidetes bacterium 46-16]